jgi:hypothetical protein
MLLKDLKADLEKGDLAYRGLCHDCGATVEVKVTVNEEGEIHISGGSVYQVNQGYKKCLFFKCDECFKEDRTLRNFRQCEVYSRVVGYLRPIQQWNKGKKEEFEMRKEFTNTQSDL